MIWILFAAGCSGDGARVVGDGEAFTLTLDVQTALNQTGLVDEVQRFDLIVEYPSGRETFPLGTAEPGGQAEVVVDPLQATSLALAGYDGADDLLAFGRSAELTIAEGELSATLTIFRVNEFAWLDLPSDDGIALSAVASTGDGSFWISGGVSGRSPFTNTDPTDAWWSLSLVGGAPEIVVEDAVLPSLIDEPGNQSSSLDVDGRAGHSMTHLGDGALLIAGGALTFVDGQLTSLESYTWDTASGEAVAQTNMPTRRGFHSSALTGSGNVVLGGGFGFTGNASQFTINESLDFFDASAGEFTGQLAALSAGSIGNAMVSLGEDGVLICGGVVNASGNDLSVSSGCDLIGVEGGITEDEALSTGVAYGQLVALGDGRALLTGGVEYPTGSTIDASDTGTVYATAKAWIYDSGTWTTVRPMNHRRAYHAAAPLPDGRVLVAGGFTQFDGLLYFWSPEPTACAEIYDPATDAWEEVGGSCADDAASAALPVRTGAPSAAWDDDYGVLLVGGVDENERTIPYAALFVGEPDL